MSDYMCVRLQVCDIKCHICLIVIYKMHETIVTNSSKVFSLYFRNKNDDRCMIDIKDLICTKTC